MFRKILLYITASVALFSLLYFSRDLLFTQPQTVSAADFDCPATMTDEECLIYLQNLANQLTQENNQINQQLSQEEINRLGIFDQLDYYNNLVVQTQGEIDKLELDVERTAVEIRILNRDVDQLLLQIDTVGQELNKTQEALQKRVAISYKRSTSSPLQLLLNGEEVNNLLRQIRYLKSTRERDLALLVDLSEKKLEFKDEQVELEAKREQVEEKREFIAQQQSQLAVEKQALAQQQGIQQQLYAESNAKIAEYTAVLDENRVYQASLDEQVSQLVAKLTAETDLSQGDYVNAGSVIGYMGNTGCSTGAHLHFSINDGNKVPGWGYFWGNVNPWSGYLSLSNEYIGGENGGWKYFYVLGNAMVLPLQGQTVLTQNHHQGMAIDLVSLDGAGAPVYAARGGNITQGVESVCGGKYVLIQHPDGLVTVYLHLQ